MKITEIKPYPTWVGQRNQMLVSGFGKQANRSGQPDFFRPTHAAHLIDRCPEVMPMLGLPEGWRFLLAPGHEDVWFDATSHVPAAAKLVHIQNAADRVLHGRPFDVAVVGELAAALDALADRVAAADVGYRDGAARSPPKSSKKSASASTFWSTWGSHT